jgi:hypothetical protein
MCKSIRKSILCLLLALTTGAALFAQEDHQWAREDVLAEPSRWGGTFGVYPEGQPLPPRPPKGYKPFYVSHMGRHGSRFVDGSQFYPKMYGIWKTAHEKGQLTPEGEKFFKAYALVYPKMLYHEGILTNKGQMQHRQIAGQLYRNYPEVFKGKTRLVALSTESSRVIISMLCCLDELSDLDRDLTIQVDYGRPYYSMLIPESHSNPNYKAMEPFTEEATERYERFAREVFDEEGVIGRWFTSTEGIGLDRASFMYDMMQLVSDSENLDFPVPEALTEVFTPEERYAIWRVQNYSDYMYTGVAPGVDRRRFLEMSVTVKDIIDRFEEDQANGISLRMRFSHDTALAPLISYLGVNGMDAMISNPYDVEKVWRSYDIPMACNFQLVFFRNRKAPDEILVQALLNGFCATLPLPEVAPGFYRWSDFKAKFDKLAI